VVAHAFNPSTWRQRQADFWVRGQPGLQSEFQDSQGYTEKPCLEKQTNKKKDLWSAFPNVQWSAWCKRRNVFQSGEVMYCVLSFLVCADNNHVRTWTVTRFRGMISTQPGSTPLASFKILSLEETESHGSYSSGNDIGRHLQRWESRTRADWCF
jgi:hypothetical protein